jgi:hypothetical protein
MDDLVLVAWLDGSDELLEDDVTLIFSQVASWILSKSHELVQITAHYVRKYHHSLFLSQEKFFQRQNVRLTRQGVVDLYLSLDVVNQVFVFDLLPAHAFQHHNLFGQDMSRHGNHSNHTTPNQPSNLILTNLSFNCFISPLRLIIWLISSRKRIIHFIAGILPRSAFSQGLWSLLLKVWCELSLKRWSIYKFVRGDGSLGLRCMAWNGSIDSLLAQILQLSGALTMILYFFLCLKVHHSLQK